ncbi:MAG: phosphate acetyltransferase [Leptospirales bacterium]|nr:phosphate acetyltransferase [Leptospirales bacterium]
MSFVESMKAKAKSAGKKLVLAEGTEPRTIKAARMIIDEKIASEVFLVGGKDAISKVAGEQGVNLNGITLIDPISSDVKDKYAKAFFEMRKHKGVTEDEAAKSMLDNLRWGAMMVKQNDASAMVAGAENSTGKVLLAGFNIIGTSPGVKSASSCFVMDMPDKKWGKDGLMIFGDCATIPDPTAEQLAEIAVQSAESCRKFLNTEPIVALLSFSTKGSAKHENVDKVLKALELVKQMAPDLKVDGELQADAALVATVGQQKAPGSTVAGFANTLIFPDLQSGNIGYKLVQRFGNAGAYGPFLQGFAQPITDLSRGCSIDEIVNTAAVTLAQA